MPAKLFNKLETRFAICFVVRMFYINNFICSAGCVVSRLVSNQVHSTCSGSRWPHIEDNWIEL